MFGIIFEGFPAFCKEFVAWVHFHGIEFWLFFLVSLTQAACIIYGIGLSCKLIWRVLRFLGWLLCGR